MTILCPLCGKEVVEVDPLVYVHDDARMTDICVEVVGVVVTERV